MGQRGFAMWDGVGSLFVQDNSNAAEAPEPADAPDENPPPPAEQGEKGPFDESYEEVMEPEEKETQKPPKPKKNRHIVGIITLIVIIVFLVLWTAISPKVMAPVGRTYLESPTYANLGNFTGTRSIWAGTTTWGVSVSGSDSFHTGETAAFFVLITKVSETTGNFFFRGTAIVITNVSIYKADGTYMGGIAEKTSYPYGKQAVVHTTFPAVGTYDLYITAKFTVYEVMRIGYFPLESVNVVKVQLEPIEVSTEPGTIIPI